VANKVASRTNKVVKDTTTRTRATALVKDTEVARPAATAEVKPEDWEEGRPVDTAAARVPVVAWVVIKAEATKATKVPSTSDRVEATAVETKASSKGVVAASEVKVKDIITITKVVSSRPSIPTRAEAKATEELRAVGSAATKVEVTEVTPRAALKADAMEEASKVAIKMIKAISLAAGVLPRTSKAVAAKVASRAAEHNQPTTRRIRAVPVVMSLPAVMAATTSTLATMATTSLRDQREAGCECQSWIARILLSKPRRLNRHSPTVYFQSC